MAYRKIKARIEDLTPALVSEFCKNPPVPGERSIKKSRIKLQREMIGAELYTGVEWAVAKDLKTDITYRVNGQHSSAVLSDLEGLKFPTHPDGSPLTAIIEEWTMDDVGKDGLRLFDQFDRPTSARSNADRTDMVKAAFADVRHLSAGFLNQICNAVEEYRASQPNYTPVSARYRSEEWLEVESVRKWALAMAPLVGSANAYFLQSAKAMAIAYEGYLANAKKATAFWTKVFNDEPDAGPDVAGLIEELKAARVKLKRGERLRSAAARAWKRFSKAHPNGNAPEPSDATQPTQTAQSA